MLSADLGCLREAEASGWLGSEANVHGLRGGMRKVVGTVLTCEDECVREYTGVNVYLQLHAVHARICYNVVKACVYMCMCCMCI